MTDKIALAEQIGWLDEIIAETQRKADAGGRDGYGAQQRIKSLQATKEALVWTMNNAEALKAFMAGRKGE